MGDAQIRRWVGTAIDEGSTTEWAAAWVVKLMMELSIAVIAGVFATEIGFRVLGFDAFNEMTGIDTTGGVLLVIIGAIFYKIMFCEYPIHDTD